MPIVLVSNEANANDKFNWQDITGVQYHYPNGYRNMIRPGERARLTCHRHSATHYARQLARDSETEPRSAIGALRSGNPPGLNSSNNFISSFVVTPMPVTATANFDLVTSINHPRLTAIPVEFRKTGGSPQGGFRRPGSTSIMTS
jgi:hypothetical protein